MLVRSVMSHLIIELLGALEGSRDHLAQHGLLLLKISDLFLEVGILFLLRDHAHLQIAVERLNQRSSSFHYLLVDVVDLGPHGV